MKLNRRLFLRMAAAAAAGRAVPIIGQPYTFSDPQLYRGAGTKPIVAMPLITSGLVANYCMANPASYPGSGTTISDLVSANTGTLTGNVFYSALTQSAFFDGNSGRIVCSNTGLTSLSALTIGCWAYYLLTTGGGALCANGSSGTRSFQSVLDVGGGKLEWYSVATDEKFSGAITAVGWHYWTITVGGGTIIWYRDGVFVSSTGISALGSTSGTLMLIGNDFYGTFFNGYMRGLHIYDRALSSTEVACSAGFGPIREPGGCPS